MKAKHLFKIIIGSSLTLVILAPTLTLTSCAKISQYTMPIMIGGTTVNDGVFGDITSHTSTSDFDGVSFGGYLPTQFDTYIDSSSGGQPNAYVYTKPDNVKDYDTTQPHSAMPQYDAGWYNYADDKLAPNKEGKNSILSYKNLNVANLSSSSSSIVYNLATMINTLLSFIKQPAVLSDVDTFSRWMFVMFSHQYNDDFFGTGNQDQIKQNKIDFYSMFFSLLNILDEGKQGIKFDISNSNFKYQSYAYGPGPIIDSTNVTIPTIADLTPASQDNLFYMADIPITNDNCPNVKILSNAYITYMKNTNTNKYVPSSMPYGIPTLFNLEDTKFAYYNPLDKHSYDQRDWLINDINVVKNRVASSNEWNAMGRLTGETDKAQWVPSLTYTVNHAITPTTTSDFDKPIRDFISNPNMPDNTDNVGFEPSWEKLMSNTNNLKPDSFFAISHYGIASYNLEEGDITSLPIRRPVFSHISSIFPTYLLYKPDGVSIDTDLFSKQYMANRLGNKDWQPEGQDQATKLYYFDESKANEKMSKVMNYLRSTIVPGQVPPTDDFSIYCLNLFQRMFGNYGGDNPSTITATDWISHP